MFKIQIHKRTIYLKPTPQKDIKEGLIIKLNKPRNEKSEPYIVCDIEAGIKDYKLPNMPNGFWVEEVRIKNDK